MINLGASGSAAMDRARSKESVFQAVYDLAATGHAVLYPISNDQYWIQLVSGEVFALGEDTVSRIA
jgi:hypothetical protein